MKHKRWATTPHYKAMMRDAARDLRARQTPSENLMWEAIRRGKLGEHARRQQQIGPFIVDFLFGASRLIIEIDGASHIGREREDRQRQEAIEELGYVFLRFSTDEVEHQLPDVLRIIRENLRRKPPPNPRQRSEGYNVRSVAPSATKERTP